MSPAEAPAAPAPAGDAGCSGGESFALRVLGDDMAPEFNDGEIIVIEPDGALKDGAFVRALRAELLAAGVPPSRLKSEQVS